MHQTLAHAIVVVHLAFVLFVVLGGLLVLKAPRLAWLHVPAAVWGVVVECAGGVCPLTPVENWLRTRGDGTGYSDGFVEHYVVPVLYPPGLTHDAQVALGLFVLALNTIIYWRAWRLRAPRAKGAHR